MPFLFLLIFPVLELLGLMRLATVVGFLNAVLWVGVTVFIGSWLMRRSASWGPRVLLAGLLILFPGLISDILGLLILSPLGRLMVPQVQVFNQKYQGFRRSTDTQPAQKNRPVEKVTPRVVDTHRIDEGASHDSD